MSNVVIDNEKLAYGLELGIGHTRTIFAGLPSNMRLRGSSCGLVSTAIYEYAQREDIPVELLISNPGLSFDADLQHVVVGVGEAGPNQRIVDASYSQFLGHVGLTIGYVQNLGEDVFPPQKVLDFELSERDVISDWLTVISVAFREHRICFWDTKYGVTNGTGPLTNSPASVIRKAFDAIWDPASMEVWSPAPHVLEHGKVVSQHIPSGAITIAS